MKLEETSSFSQLFPWLCAESAVKGWSWVLSTEGGGNPGGGCQDGLVGGNEDPQMVTETKTLELLLHLAECCFSCSLSVEINSHGAECVQQCLTITLNKYMFKA